MTRFGVMNKPLAGSIPSRFLYFLVKSLGWTTTRIWAISNFQMLVKMENYFYGLVVCEVELTLLCKALLELFVNLFETSSINFNWVIYFINTTLGIVSSSLYTDWCKSFHVLVTFVKQTNFWRLNIKDLRTLSCASKISSMIRNYL